MEENLKQKIADLEAMLTQATECLESIKAMLTAESEPPEPSEPAVSEPQISEPQISEPAVLEPEESAPDAETFTPECEQPQPEQEPLASLLRPDSIGEHFEKTMPQKNLHVTTPYNSATLSKSMSLNDRFRYQRELFQNDSAKMAEMMAIIDNLSSMKEAEEYLRSSMDWDEETEAVQDFYSMLEEHFL